MKKIDTLFKALKVLMVNLIICSLMQNPFISNAMAAGTSTNANASTRSGGFNTNDIFQMANGALNIYGGYLGQKQMMIQSQIASANNQRLMAQLGPSGKGGGPSKYFPECSLPASMTQMPENVCERSAMPDPNHVAAMITYESIAKGWMNYYDQMSNSASNVVNPNTGLACLKDKQAKLDAQLTEMMNNLQRLQDQMNRDKQVFRDNNKQLLSDMDTANAELFGAGAGGNNLNAKTQDMSKLFSQSCQTIIGRDGLKAIKDKGLNNVVQDLSAPTKAASDFNLNKAAIENDVRNEANKIAATITTGGVEDFLKNGYIPQSADGARFGAIGNQIQIQAKEFATAKARIDKTLGEVGYTAPALDSKFSADSADFMAGANDFFRKKYINDCVTKADSGVAIPITDVLGSIENRRLGNEISVAIPNFRAALKKIIESDAMFSDKMAQIQALEANYPGMTVTYKDASQNTVSESPYALFTKTIAACDQRFAQNDQFANNGSSANVSYQKKVERAKAALQELKTLNDGYASKVSGAILSQVLSCGGSAPKAGSCSEGSFKTDSPNFCISGASQCANEMQGCYAEANNQVQIRKTKMDTLSKTFNANVAQMIARSNALYDQQKTAVMNMTKLLQTKFPEANFAIPKDMFVTTPELSKDKYGVDMAANGDLTALLDGPGSMTTKIDLLKQTFKEQQKAIKDVTGPYIADQESAMKDQRARWKSLNDRCIGMVDGESQAIAKQNSEGLKAQSELDGKVSSFCSKYYGIAQADNPVGACDEAKGLTDNIDQIATRLTGQSKGLARQIASTCNGFNNEASSTSQDCTYISDPKDKEICQRQAIAQLSKAQGSSSSAKKIRLGNLCANENTSESDLIARIAKNLSKADQDNLKGVNNWNDFVRKSADQEINDNGFILGVNDLIKDESGSNICKKLSAINQAEPLDDKTYADKKAELKKNETANQETLAKLEAQKKNAALKTNLDSLLADLGSVSSPAGSSVKEIQLNKVSKLGEQISGTQCDANSNNMLGKNLFNFDLNSHDQQILGSSGLTK